MNISKLVLFSLMVFGAILVPTITSAFNFNEANRKALNLFRQNEKQDAIGLWLDAVNIAKDSEIKPANLAEILNNLGYAFYELKEYQKAEKYLIKSSRADNGRWSVHLNLGDLYYEQGRCSEYIKEYKTVLGLNPSYKYKQKLKERLKEALYPHKNVCKDKLAVGFVSECGKYYRKTNIYNAHTLEYFQGINSEYIKNKLRRFYDTGKIKTLSTTIVKTIGGKRIYELGSEMFRLFIYEIEENKYIPLSLETYCSQLEPSFTKVPQGTLFETILYSYRGNKVAFYFLFDDDGELIRSFNIEGLTDEAINKSKEIRIDLPRCVSELNAISRCYNHTLGVLDCYFMLNGSSRPKDGNVLASISYSYKVDKDSVNITSYNVKDKCFMFD